MDLTDKNSTQGEFSAKELDDETNESILAAINTYTLILRIISLFFTIMMFLMVLSGIYHIPEQLESWKDNSGNIIPVAYVTIALEFVVMIFIARLMFKLYMNGYSILKAVKQKDYTFSIGFVTDKSSYRSERGGGSRKTIYVDNLPCSDISNFYYEAHLGVPCYILYINKCRYCFPYKDNEKKAL